MHQALQVQARPGGLMFKRPSWAQAAPPWWVPPVLEEVDPDPRHLGQLVVQRRKLAQHPAGHRQRRLACGVGGDGGRRGLGWCGRQTLAHSTGGLRIVSSLLGMSC